jgi:hypothetical protein
VAKQKEVFCMGISSISSTSMISILTLLNKSTASSEEASLLGSKITDLQSKIEEAQESGESSTENDSDESETDSTVNSGSEDSGSNGTTDTSTIEEMQAQVVQYQVRLAQIAGENVKTNMQDQFDALNNNTKLNSINNHLMDIIS